LISVYLDSVGVSTVKEIGRLFRWEKKIVLRALEDLAAKAAVFPVDEESWATSGLSM